MNETASLEQLAALVDFSADAAVLVDADGVIRWANPATPDVLGYEPADLIGVRVKDLVAPDDQPAWSTLVTGLFDRPGIAHDFNNLLTAIRGNAELMSHRVKHDPAMAAEVDESLHAADRAASLTRQLLLFSRKQVLQPVALDQVRGGAITVTSERGEGASFRVFLPALTGDTT